MILRRFGDKEQTGPRKLLKSCFSGRGMKYNALIFQQNIVDPYEIYEAFLLITAPISKPSKDYKHLRKAVGFRELELCRHCRFRARSF